jgi:hypothetical protein
VTRLKKLDIFDIDNCFIAGGAVLSTVIRTEIADYDIYPKNLAGLHSVLEAIKDSSGVITFISPKAISFQLYIDGGIYRAQVMTFDWFPDTDKIFENFDFTVCMAAYDCDSKEYIFHPDFYPDVATRFIRFNPKTRFPLASLVRLKKYQKKGFSINGVQLASMALALQTSAPPTSWGELENQLGGVYGKRITIQAEDREFSIEAAYEVLDQMSLDETEYMVDRKDEFEKILPSDIMDFFTIREDSKTKYQLVKLASGHYYYGIMRNQYFIRDDLRMNTQLIDIYGYPGNVELTDAASAFGFIVRNPVNGMILKGGTVFPSTDLLKDYLSKYAGKPPEISFVSVNLESYGFLKSTAVSGIRYELSPVKYNSTHTNGEMKLESLEITPEDLAEEFLVRSIAAA